MAFPLGAFRPATRVLLAFCTSSGLGGRVGEMVKNLLTRPTHPPHIMYVKCLWSEDGWSEDDFCWSEDGWSEDEPTRVIRLKKNISRQKSRFWKAPNGLVLLTLTQSCHRDSDHITEGRKSNNEGRKSWCRHEFHRGCRGWGRR